MIRRIHTSGRRGEEAEEEILINLFGRKLNESNYPKENSRLLTTDHSFQLLAQEETMHLIQHNMCRIFFLIPGLEMNI